VGNLRSAIAESPANRGQFTQTCAQRSARLHVHPLQAAYEPPNDVSCWPREVDQRMRTKGMPARLGFAWPQMPRTTLGYPWGNGTTRHPKPTSSPGPVLINWGRWTTVGQCPLCPRKRTSIARAGMSALCQKRTWGSTAPSLWACTLCQSLDRLPMRANALRSTSKMIAVDHPNSNTPFIAVIGPSKRQSCVGRTSP
jgi:hypothetical protein